MPIYKAEVVVGDKTKHITLIGEPMLVQKRIVKWQKDGKVVTCKLVDA